VASHLDDLVTYEMKSGHDSSHQRQVVRPEHLGSITSPASSRLGPGLLPDSRRICFVEAFRWSRMSMVRSRGTSGFLVMVVGHTTVQRPHSVQVYRSRSCFHV
jgi:hypothetical protein